MMISTAWISSTVLVLLSLAIDVNARSTSPWLSTTTGSFFSQRRQTRNHNFHTINTAHQILLRGGSAADATRQVATHNFDTNTAAITTPSIHAEYIHQTTGGSIIPKSSSSANANTTNTKEASATSSTAAAAAAAIVSSSTEKSKPIVVVDKSTKKIIKQQNKEIKKKDKEIKKLHKQIAKKLKVSKSHTTKACISFSFVFFSSLPLPLPLPLSNVLVSTDVAANYSIWFSFYVYVYVLLAKNKIQYITLNYLTHSLTQNAHFPPPSFLQTHTCTHILLTTSDELKFDYDYDYDYDFVNPNFSTVGLRYGTQYFIFPTKQTVYNIILYNIIYHIYIFRIVMQQIKDVNLCILHGGYYLHH
jgi:hypothetical protein